MKKQIAFTLLELLISLFIASILLIGLIRIYLIIQANSRRINAINAIQENIEYLRSYLTKRIRNAGSIDCLADKKDRVNKGINVIGYSSRSIPTAWHIKVKAGSDAFVLLGCYPVKNKRIFIQTIYFVGDTHRQNQLKQPIYALYQKKYKGHRQELLDNVNNLHIRFGLYAKHIRSISRYLSPVLVSNWRQLKAVILKLELSNFSKINPVPFHRILLYIALNKGLS